MELEAIRSSARTISLESLVRVIRRSGTTDAVDDGRSDAGSEISQDVGQDAFAEAEARAVECGPDDGYPFEIGQGFLRLRKGWKSSPYILLLLLSQTEPTTGHQGTAVLFERLCAHAAQRFLGGDDNRVVAYRFGSPRKPPHSKLSQAIDKLCVDLSEGGGCRNPTMASHTGDDGLDIVAWRPFSDRKIGKLVAFGQCATGEGFSNKLNDLDGRKFAQKWFRDPLPVDPVRLFFLPRRIPNQEWEGSSIAGGIVFDRCRIVSCLGDLNAELASDCKVTAKYLLQELTIK